MYLGVTECCMASLAPLTLILTSDFSSRIFVCRAYLPYTMKSRNFKFGVWVNLGAMGCCIPFRITLTLNVTSGISLRIIMSRTCLIYYINPRLSK